MGQDDKTGGKAPKASRISPLGQKINILYETDRNAAAEVALAKFLSPGRMLPNPKQRQLLDTAQAKTIHVEGIPIKTYTWPAGPDASTVVLVHGFLGSAAAMLAYVQHLRSTGYSVVTFDHVAHGESGGESVRLHLWMQTILSVLQMAAPLAGTIAFSMGATITALVLAEHPEINCPFLCSLNAPLSARRLMLKFLQINGCSSDLVGPVFDAAKKQGITWPDIISEVLPQSAKLPNTRVLVVQDRDDTVATVEGAEWLASTLPQAKLHFTEKLEHNGPLMSADVVRSVLQFVTEKDGAQLSPDAAPTSPAKL
jgi:pimeloyl-ACP methyl ester carboxylesterase